jgi:hypothetical protein
MGVAMKKFITAFILLIVFLNLLSCSYSNERCSNSAPKDGQVFNPDDWIIMNCSSMGDQFFTSNINYVWVPIIDDIGNQFFASGEIAEGQTKKFSIFPSEFTDIYALGVDTVTRKNLNEMLQKELKRNQIGQVQLFDDIKFIRLLSDAGFSYEVAIFVKVDVAEWILVCRTYCNNDEPIVLSASKLNPE